MIYALSSPTIEVEQLRLHRVQGNVRPDWSPCTLNLDSRLVETDEEARRIVKELEEGSCKEIAFDTEGVNLSRTGELTVVTIALRQPCAIAYIFDIVSIGRAIFAGKYSLKNLLESTTVRKVTFDCRTDSDALYHQYQVRLKNCLDLQVFQLGIKIQNGTYDERYPGNLRSLDYICGRYLTADQCQALFAGKCPHKEDNEVWRRRPLCQDTLQYAANDVHAINALLQCMRGLVLSKEGLEDRISAGSEAYTSVFRDAEQLSGESDWGWKRKVVPI